MRSSVRFNFQSLDLLEEAYADQDVPLLQFYRTPLSKQHNKYLQSVLIEAAKVAPLWNPQLKEVHERALAHGHRNQATLAVARKLVAYMMAVDRSGKPFGPKMAEAAASL